MEDLSAATRRAAGAALLVLVLSLSLSRPSAADTPLWPSDSVIYNVYPSIFSPQRNFAGVTAQLPRLKHLGITVLWMLPVTPLGQAINGHPSYGSPYSVRDYFAVNPEYGTVADLQALVTAAHKLGIQVILDEVLNHTSWDNALITQHPEYYVHTDSNPSNPASIEKALTYADVAQLNYANADLRAYMIGMLQFWITTYQIDGFRFDSASTPDGPNRRIPADFWQEMGVHLRRARPDLLLLGECETPDLALKPFTLDYGWHVHDALRDASNGGSAAGVEAAWRYEADSFPPGMKHMAVQDDWDFPRDVNTLEGPTGALAAAAFNLTSTNIPLIYNGMEIGNALGATNPHDVLDWQGGDARFPPFYHEMIALRRGSAALREGTMTWLPNSVPSRVLTYLRAGGGSEYLVEINLSAGATHGVIQSPVGAGWAEVKLTGMRNTGKHTSPPEIALQPKEFALFQRSAPTPKENQMHTKLLPAVAAAAALSVLPASAQPPATFTDNAGNYTAAQGYAGQGGSTPGFGAFVVKASAAGNAGTYIGDASYAEKNTGTPSTGTINTDGKAFAFFANSDPAASVTVTRPFSQSLSHAGESFSLDFVTGDNAGGSVAVELRSGPTPVGVFTYNGADGKYYWNGAATGASFQPGVLHLTYTLTSATAYSFMSTGAVTFKGSGALPASLTGFETQQTAASLTNGANFNAFFNNLKLTLIRPTPAP